jgi:hypothetical protein
MYQKSTKPEPELSEWDRAAIAYAKSRPRDDGTIGAIVKAGPAGDAWVAYFRAKGMKVRASFVKYHLATGNSCTMPSKLPEEFDPTFSGAGHRSHARNRETGKTTDEKKEPLDRTRWWDR